METFAWQQGPSVLETHVLHAAQTGGNDRKLPVCPGPDGMLVASAVGAELLIRSHIVENGLFDGQALIQSQIATTMPLLFVALALDGLVGVGVRRRWWRRLRGSVRAEQVTLAGQLRRKPVGLLAEELALQPVELIAQIADLLMARVDGCGQWFGEVMAGRSGHGSTYT